MKSTTAVFTILKNPANATTIRSLLCQRSRVFTGPALKCVATATHTNFGIIVRSVFGWFVNIILSWFLLLTLILEFICFCLRPKAKDLGITWVVLVVEFFVWSMHYQLPPPCYTKFYYFLIYCFFIFFID